MGRYLPVADVVEALLERNVVGIGVQQIRRLAVLGLQKHGPTETSLDSSPGKMLERDRGAEADRHHRPAQEIRVVRYVQVFLPLPPGLHVAYPLAPEKRQIERPVHPAERLSDEAQRDVALHAPVAIKEPRIPRLK